MLLPESRIWIWHFSNRRSAAFSVIPRAVTSEVILYPERFQFSKLSWAFTISIVMTALGPGSVPSDMFRHVALCPGISESIEIDMGRENRISAATIRVAKMATASDILVAKGHPDLDVMDAAKNMTPQKRVR